MKKIILFFLALLIVLPCFAEVYFEPEWKEFCPSRYANISTNRWHCTSSGRYWAERKSVFEERLAKCNSLEGEEKSACYKSLRELEANASNMYNNERNRRALKNIMINSMF